MTKKTILIGAFLIVLSLPFISIASTIGNNSDTQGGFGKFSIGFEYDRVFDRDLDWKKGTLSEVVPGSPPSSEPLVYPGDTIKDVEPESNRLFLKGTMGILPKLDVFLKLGMADAKYTHKYESPVFPNEVNEFDGDWDYAWGIGTKTQIFQIHKDLNIMADAQYVTYEVDGDSKSNGIDLSEVVRQSLTNLGYTNVTSSYDSEADVEEWQVALYVNQNFDEFSSYAGIKYSDVRIKNEIRMKGTASGSPYWIKSKEKLEADDNFGVFLGTDIYLIPNKLSVNFEGRLIDETAATVGLSYRF